MADSPYPEIKKTHTMARQGRPWSDHKPPPSGPVWNVLCGLASYAVLQAARELDIFDELERIGPATASELAQRLGLSEPHLGVLLDSVVVLGLLDQCREVYDLNDTARCYLLSGSPASMSELLAVAAGPWENWQGLAETVRGGAPPRPVDADTDFYLPLVRGTFATQHRVATRADLMVGYSRAAGEGASAGGAGGAGGELALLELGAGGAPWACAVLSACAGASAVVNDFAPVLAVAQEKVAEFGVAPRCEFLAGDYHSVEVGDAIASDSFDLVVLGHLCRAEGEAGTRALLGLAWRALRPGGRVLVTDYFCDPTRKHNPHGVLMGAVMMANTQAGFTFTPGRFAELLEEVGFGQLRRVEPIGFQHLVVATKPGPQP